MEKLIRDGMVAVIYSPGVGSGWSHWDAGCHDERMIFDPEVAEAVLSGDKERIKKTILDRFPNDYPTDSTLKNIQVEWLPVGTPFNIEYDHDRGSEDISSPYYGEVEYKFTA